MDHPPRRSTKTHLAAYGVAVATLIALAIGIRDVDHSGSPSLHTLMESVGTVLALMVGTISLVRYRARRDLPYLFIGVGFLGNGILEAIHAWTSSVYAYQLFPSGLEEIALWGWTAKRVFLGMMLVLAGWAWWWGEADEDEQPAVQDRHVYLLAAIYIMVAALALFLVRLPMTRFDDWLVPRPQEYVSALLFLAAIIGFFAMGRWRGEPAEHWLVLALIVALATQTIFMPFSCSAWDQYYDMAHLLVIASSTLALVGLLLNVHVLQRKLVREERRLVDVNTRLEEEILRRSAAEEHAEDQSGLLRSVFDSIGDGIIAADQEGRLTHHNHAAVEILGKGMPDVPPEEWPAYFGVYRPDGHTPLRFDELPLVRALRGEIVEDQNVYLRNEGRPEGAYVTTSARPLHDPDGTVAGAVVVVRDITQDHHIQEQLHRYTGELERRNQDLEDFATIVSHDLKEPLRKVLAFGERLENKLGHDIPADAADHLRRMRQAADRMRALIDDLLAYTRLNQLQTLEEVDLNDVVVRAVQDLEERLLETGGKVEVGTLCRISCDPVQMYQVFANLIGNGLKYHRADVPPQVKVRGESNGNRCRIIIEDNGIGIDMKYAERIFRPFHRLHTRSEYEGSGIGLAIVRKIVEQHGGSVAVDSTPGTGSRFILDLPLAPQELEVANVQ